MAYPVCRTSRAISRSDSASSATRSASSTWISPRFRLPKAAIPVRRHRADKPHDQRGDSQALPLREPRAITGAPRRLHWGRYIERTQIYVKRRQARSGDANHPFVAHLRWRQGFPSSLVPSDDFWDKAVVASPATSRRSTGKAVWRSAPSRDGIVIAPPPSRKG